MSPEPFLLLNSPLEGRNLIEASAGTGKTYTIAALFVRLLLEVRLPVDRILVVTFTEAATEELRGRIRARLRDALEAFRALGSEDPFLKGLLEKIPPSDEVEAALSEAIRSFDQAAVFTIHGFCQGVLREKAFECGATFDAELLTDEGPLLQEVVDDFWRRELHGVSPGFATHVSTKGLGPEALGAFLARRARAPLLRVVPEEVVPDSGELEARCGLALEEVRRLWCGTKAEVLRLLQTYPGLNRNRYRPGSVPVWGAAMEQYLAVGDPLAPFEALPRFCSSTLARAATGGHSPPSHPLFEACEALQQLRDELQTLFEARVRDLKTRLIRLVRAELPRRKAERNVRSFDDLLREVGAALSLPEGASLARTLRERYPAALIDEFQDTDPVQYGIFRAVYPDASCRLFLIGDPKQAIYGFRGADVFAYMEASRRVDRHWTLGQNWRSVPALVAGVNAVFGNAPEPFLFDRIPFRPAAAADRADARSLTVDGELNPAPLRLWFAHRRDGRPIGRGQAEQQDLPAAVAGEVARLLTEGARGRAFLGPEPLGPEHLAVLVRTHRQARYVQEALRARGVPSVLHSSESVFGSREAEEMLRVLAALADRGSDGRTRAALVTDLFGVTAEELDAADDRRWDGWLRKLDAYHALWAGRGFVAMARTLLAAEGVRARLLPYPDGERRLTNVLHLVEVLQRAAVEGRLGPEGVVQWLGRCIEEGPAGEEQQIRLETDERAVQIVTVHKSKGLEYPVTFCPFGWGGSREKDDEVLFHDPEEPTRVVLDLGSEASARHRRLAEREALAENVRLLYVALTRARNRCYVVWGAYRGSDTSALAHLLHPPTEPFSTAGENAVERLSDHMEALTDEDMFRHLTSLSERAAPAIRVEPIPHPGADRYSPPARDENHLCHRPFRGSIASEWGIASFSSLVSGREETSELPDRDEVPSQGSEGPGEPPLSPAGATFFDFPRGPGAGRCLHAIMELADFAVEARDDLGELIAGQLRLHGFDAKWAGPVSDGLFRVLRAPLDPGDPASALCRLRPEERAHELEFYLPAGLLTPRALAQVFAAADGPEVPEELAPALRTLGFRPVRGFLKGFVDLVFSSGGRYHFLDWKSNHLGNRVEDYGPEGLRRAMDEHLYGLQYHLYAAALHRHFAARLPGYDYERHFGNVYYVFLRGVDPTAGPEFGIYRARPSHALVTSLAAYIAGGA